MITASFIRELLDYDPETGHFTYRKAQNRNPAGSRAGGLGTKGYRDIKIKGKEYAEHRLAWLWVYGSFPTDTIDHINRDPTDNRISNLREATRKQQVMNRHQKRRYQSDLPRGVRRTSSGKYSARLNVRTNPKHLGTYDTPEEAHAAYCAAAKAAYGEFFFSGQPAPQSSPF